MSDTSTDPYDDAGYDPVPAGSDPPEGIDELALQEAEVGTDAEAPTVEAPTPVGRTYALDLKNGRLLPEGLGPARIEGDAARRQAIEKCLRTDRGAAAVHDDQYGLEGASRQVEGQAFDAEAFSITEQRIREALVGSLPWVLDVVGFDAYPDPAKPSIAVCEFTVVPDGDDQDPLYIDEFPLPIPGV